jgi:hypothetical protein
MRKILILFLTIFLVSCAPSFAQKGDATAILEDLLCHFQIREGILYSDRTDAEHPLSDALLARMFDDDGDMADFAYVTSVSVYFSRHFSEREILVLQISDLSHQTILKQLLQKRARKKENAVVFTNGIDLYLICTNRNEDIIRYLK